MADTLMEAHGTAEKAFSLISRAPPTVAGHEAKLTDLSDKIYKLHSDLDKVRTSIKNPAGTPRAREGVREYDGGPRY